VFAVILAWFVVAAVLAFLASDVTYLSYFFSFAVVTEDVGNDSCD